MRSLASTLAFAASALPIIACSVTASETPSSQPGASGELSAACALLAPCCERWPQDLRRSCSGPAEVRGPEGESACKTFLSNGIAKAYCPELDILDCSVEMRKVMGDTCVGGVPAQVGLDTFAASNLGKIEVPAEAVDVTFDGGAQGAVCDVDAATGASTCLGGDNKLVAKRVGEYDVLFAKNLTVGSKAFVSFYGTRPVIVVAEGILSIEGMISVGYTTRSLGDTKARPGAQSGGPGVGGTYYGGGAFCGNGGDGFQNASKGGVAYGKPELTPLLGGSHGSDPNSGGAGGAVQLVAGTRIRVLGLVHANGQDGYNGGGGSGGAVLLEAPLVEGSGALSADGGAGGKNVNTNDGGGAGGSGGSRDGKPATRAYASGGGGAGRIRINARTQSFKGTLSPSAASTCATQGPLFSL